MVVGFGKWLAYGLPVSCVMLILAWLYMTRVAYKGLPALGGGRAVIRRELLAMGPMSPGEKRAALVFACVGLGWLTRPLWGDHLPLITDAVIAVAGAVATFVVPVSLRRGEFLNDWEPSAASRGESCCSSAGGFRWPERSPTAVLRPGLAPSWRCFTGGRCFRCSSSSLR